ncbi:hypothetical protein TcWFU_008875 [Taenia crassiceps]|uniref:Uncharacterized protein n=1 Tax=Taenia crassiceps TaxID=6207 RepID=A0ABR4Q8K5_9CEST
MTTFSLRCDTLSPPLVDPTSQDHCEMTEAKAFVPSSEHKAVALPLSCANCVLLLYCIAFMSSVWHLQQSPSGCCATDGLEPPITPSMHLFPAIVTRSGLPHLREVMLDQIVEAGLRPGGVPGRRQRQASLSRSAAQTSCQPTNQPGMQAGRQMTVDPPIDAASSINRGYRRHTSLRPVASVAVCMEWVNDCFDVQHPLFDHPIPRSTCIPLLDYIFTAPSPSPTL